MAAELEAELNQELSNEEDDLNAVKSFFPDRIFAPFFIFLIFNFFFTCQALFLYNDKGLLLLKII